MFHNIPKNIVVAGRIVRQKVMASLALDGGKRVENFLAQGLVDGQRYRTFAPRESR